jgi:hypothetical protein
VKLKWLQGLVAWPSWLQEENDMWGHNSVVLKFETWSSKKDINRFFFFPSLTLKFWCDVGHVTKKSGYFVGLSVCIIVDGCVCVFQCVWRAAAFSGAELLLPPCQVNCRYCWAARWLCHTDSCVLRLVIQVFRLLLCCNRRSPEVEVCDILHLGVNMQGINGPWSMYWLISNKKYLCHLKTDVCTFC